MGHTVIGVFRYSGDADLAAAHLREEYALEADELDVIGPDETENLTPPAATLEGTDGWVVATLTGIGLAPSGDEDPIGKRWGDKVNDEQTLVVARTNDPDVAESLARELRRTGAERIDLLPH